MDGLEGFHFEDEAGGDYYGYTNRVGFDIQPEAPVPEAVLPFVSEQPDPADPGPNVPFSLHLGRREQDVLSQQLARNPSSSSSQHFAGTFQLGVQQELSHAFPAGASYAEAHLGVERLGLGAQLIYHNTLAKMLSRANFGITLLKGRLATQENLRAHCYNCIDTLMLHQRHWYAGITRFPIKRHGQHMEFATRDKFCLIMVAESCQATKEMEMHLIAKYSGNSYCLNRSRGGEQALESFPHYLYLSYASSRA